MTRAPGRTRIAHLLNVKRKVGEVGIPARSLAQIGRKLQAT